MQKLYIRFTGNIYTSFALMTFWMVVTSQTTSSTPISQAPSPGVLIFRFLRCVSDIGVLCCLSNANLSTGINRSAGLKCLLNVLIQWFLTRVNFVPQGICGNIWKHFWSLQQERR